MAMKSYSHDWEASSISKQSWELLPLQHVVCQEFDFSGKYCAFCLTSGSTELWDFSSIPMAACLLRSSLIDETEWVCRSIAWSESSMFLCSVFQSKHSNASLVLLWNVLEQQVVTSFRLLFVPSTVAFIPFCDSHIIVGSSDLYGNVIIDLTAKRMWMLVTDEGSQWDSNDVSIIGECFELDELNTVNEDMEIEKNHSSTEDTYIQSNSTLIDAWAIWKSNHSKHFEKNNLAASSICVNNDTSLSLLASMQTFSSPQRAPTSPTFFDSSTDLTLDRRQSPSDSTVDLTGYIFISTFKEIETQDCSIIKLRSTVIPHVDRSRGPNIKIQVIKSVRVPLMNEAVSTYATSSPGETKLSLSGGFRAGSGSPRPAGGNRIGGGNFGSFLSVSSTFGLHKVLSSDDLSVVSDIMSRLELPCAGCSGGGFLRGLTSQICGSPSRPNNRLVFWDFSANHMSFSEGSDDSNYGIKMLLSSSCTLPKAGISSLSIRPNHPVIVAKDNSGYLWVYALRPQSDFPGPMYPIGFKLMDKVVPYYEAEDELDKEVINPKQLTVPFHTSSTSLPVTSNTNRATNRKKALSLRWEENEANVLANVDIDFSLDKWTGKSYQIDLSKSMSTTLNPVRGSRLERLPWTPQLFIEEALQHSNSGGGGGATGSMNLTALYSLRRLSRLSLQSFGRTLAGDGANVMLPGLQEVVEWTGVSSTYGKPGVGRRNKGISTNELVSVNLHLQQQVLGTNGIAGVAGVAGAQTRNSTYLPIPKRVQCGDFEQRLQKERKCGQDIAVILTDKSVIADKMKLLQREAVEAAKKAIDRKEKARVAREEKKRNQAAQAAQLQAQLHERREEEERMRIDASKGEDKDKNNAESVLVESCEENTSDVGIAGNKRSIDLGESNNIDSNSNSNIMLSSSLQAISEPEGTILFDSNEHTSKSRKIETEDTS